MRPHWKALIAPALVFLAVLAGGVYLLAKVSSWDGQAATDVRWFVGLVMAGLVGPGWPLAPNVFLLGLTTGAFSIAVAPGNATVAKNGDQLVAATLNGFTAEQTTLLVRGEDAPGWTRLDMARDSSGRWTFRLFDVGAATDYAVEAAGVRSPTYRLAVAPIPYVARVDLEYRYPAYTQLAPRQVDSTGAIAARAPDEVVERIRLLMDERRSLEKQLADAKKQTPLSR